MSIFSLRKRFFGGVCEFPKFSIKSFLVFLLGVSLLSFSFPVSAADSPPENPTTNTEVTPKAAETPELSTYKLEVGDSFVVTVDGYPEYSKERIPVPVQEDGYVSYPLIGLIKVAGLTVSELEAQMQSAFSKHLPTARVFVTLMKPKRSILVFGAVEPRPRGNLHVFEVGQVYLLQALASAGINYEAADLTDISIWRAGKLYKRIDYLQLMSSGGPDIPLKDYDTIYIPSIFQQRPVRVIGAVVAPGVYPITTPQVPATQVLKIAGGSRTDFADLHKSEILTSKERILVNLAAENVNAMLGPGDTLYVPLAEAKISVTGAVEKPGQYVITEPILLGQAIAMAGGFNEERANPKKCLLTRADGTEEELNFDQVHSEVYLNPKDQLRIRERTRLDWRVITFGTSFVNLLVTVLFRYRN
ncbi:MAG: polysaccharide biosynthesis/export family protein [Candidatus Poribacteria bacterium]|nr:polysaccharide biosynthesis/export family protein [Candidatus Poribacteria bacterium]